MKMEEWKKCKLGEFFELHRGYDLTKSEIKEGPYPVVCSTSIMGYHNEYKVKAPGVVIGRSGTLGEVQFIDTDYWPHNTSLYVSDFKGNSPKFIKYFLQLFGTENVGGGSAVPTLNRNHLQALTVRVPPLPTQQKIAAILSSLDDKIELNNKINTNLERQAQALFKNWFVDKYEKEGTIGDYCAVKSGFAFKSAWWQDEGTKVIRIGDIEQGCLNLETCAHVATDKIEVAKDFIVQGGDLVIAMTGATIGKFSMIPKTQEPILVNQRVGKFFLGNNPIEKVPFIYCTLKQEEVITEFINRGQGSAQPNISTGDILSIPCWIPNKNEIDNFNKTIQPMFETIISNQEENRKLSGLRDSLLPKLMNGEIEV